MAEGDDTNAASMAPAADELPWERARRERLAQIEAEQAHGEELLERYGRGDTRPQFTNVGRVNTRRLRR